MIIVTVLLKNEETQCTIAQVLGCCRAVSDTWSCHYEADV